MSVQAEQNASDSTTTSLPESAPERIVEFVKQEFQESDADSYYFKSCHIADEIGLTPKEIGSNIHQAREVATDISIEKWGRSSATVWEVTSAYSG